MKSILIQLFKLIFKNNVHKGDSKQLKQNNINKKSISIKVIQNKEGT